jgi:hypothetical protein
MINFNIKNADTKTVVSSQLDMLVPFKNRNIEPLGSTAKLLKGRLSNTDTDLLIKDTLEAVKIYGMYGYRLTGKTTNGELRKNKSYLGMGLTYNPNHLDLSIDPLVDPHEQTQGNHWPGTKGSGIHSHPFSRITDPSERTKAAILNSHYDTYSIAYRTEGSNHGYLRVFLDSIKSSLVRSSVRIIDSSMTGGGGDVGIMPGIGWHVDESVFENLRVNIAIETDPIFVLEQYHRRGQLFHLEAPFAYTWDTGISHRAYATKRTEQPILRTHIMLGIASWWDFDPMLHTWTPNEFHGKKHPVDMLIDGDIIPGFELVDEL